MSLTNDQITAKNFKEFYEAIRPYLNGSFPTPIANKFDKANMYSTDEQIVGRWIDGKPLYQKTYYFATPIAVTTSLTTLATVTDLSIDKLVDSVAGIASTTGGEEWVWDCFLVKLTSDKTTLQARIPTNDALGTDHITIKYTKTTDTAMEIGSDTDYSTTEKIIGTWIDGKPLYQKTFTGTSSSTADANTDITIADNVERVIYVWGMQDYGTNNSNPFGNYFTTNDYQSAWIVTGNILRLRTTVTSKPYIVTIQYTKTTD